jgi:hypothetical protein
LIIRGVLVKYSTDYIDFIKGNKIIRISQNHAVYKNDIVDSFEYYWSAVKFSNISGYELVDYSTARFHEVIGYDLMPIYFPSFSEPVSTNVQYLNFANLSQGMVAFDLGAYSGLTSIMFKELVGETGCVIAVEPDQINQIAIDKNFNLFKKIQGQDIHLFKGAVWEHCDGLNFAG